MNVSEICTFVRFDRSTDLSSNKWLRIVIIFPNGSVGSYYAADPDSLYPVVSDLVVGSDVLVNFSISPKRNDNGTFWGRIVSIG